MSLLFFLLLSILLQAEEESPYAAFSALAKEEIPAALTVITRREIENCGARDLAEVLALVPGFSLALYKKGAVGVGIRGLWSFEGKVLFLVDGQEINELMFGTMPLGNHILLEQVERIEILRGSAAIGYGGLAELGVVNVVTRPARALNGTQISTSLGNMNDSLGHRNFTLAYGRESKGLAFKSIVSFGRAVRSDREYSDGYGNSFLLKSNADLNPANGFFGLEWHQFRATLIIDRYHLKTRDGVSRSAPVALPANFESMLFELKREMLLGQRGKTVFYLNFKNQLPWLMKDDASEKLAAADPENYGELYYKRVARLLRLGAQGEYAFSKACHIAGKAEYSWEQAKAILPERQFANGKFQIDFRYFTLSADLLYRWRGFHLLGGFRYQWHSLMGSLLAPRFALGRAWTKWHFQVRWSKSFRMPGLEMLGSGSDLLNEYSEELAAEAGISLNDKWTFAGTVYDIRLLHPIIASFAVPGSFENSGNLHGRGLELELRCQEKWGYLAANYSHYLVVKNQMPGYVITEKPGLMPGFPAHKLALQGNAYLGKYFSLNSSCIFYSQKYGWAISAAESGMPVLRSYAGTMQLNVFLLARSLCRGRLDLGAGVYNLLNEDILFVQPYSGQHAPLPGTSREWLVRIVFRFL